MSTNFNEHLAEQIIKFMLPLGDELAGRVAQGVVPSTRKSSAGDLVTALDIEVEARLRTFLGGLLPGSSFVGEENANEPNGGLDVWVVDPIDGTTNVVHGVRYAAISVALLRDNDVVIGIVHNIFDRTAAMATAGRGAVQVRPDGSRTALKVSATSSLASALVSFGLPYDRKNSARLFRAAEKVFAASQDLRRQGSAALDLVSVASGRLEAHFELDLRVWDIAAAGLILSEAGGRLTDWLGEPLVFRIPEARITVQASNGLVHSELRQVLAADVG